MKKQKAAFKMSRVVAGLLIIFGVFAIVACQSRTGSQNPVQPDDANVTPAPELSPEPVSRNLAQMDDDFHVNPIPGLDQDFIMGADVSMLAQIEQSGGKFYVNGVEEDCLTILRDHGVNWIRLRVWVDPTDEDGNWLGGGNNDLARTVELASRAKQLGFKVLIDFHYSDWWADPGKQTKPRAWAELEGEELQQAVYDHTANVIQSLVEANASPDMVQLGNEINGGMLWPDGKIWQEGDEQIGGFEGLAALLGEGVQAVRDHDPHGTDPEKRIRIMIHLADGGDNALYHTVFDGLTEQGVDYDIIGLSYYAYWHGPLQGLIDNMNEISAYYDKPVIVVETAFAFTVEAGDEQHNMYGDGLQEQVGYQATVQGQATALRDVMAAVAQVPDGNGLGIFYWEPDWIPVEGAGWRSGEGDSWENQALFDFDGNALASLSVFHLVRPEEGRESIEAGIVEFLPVKVKLPLQGILELPATAKAVFSDDSIHDVAVTWNNVDPGLVSEPGVHTLSGTADGTDQQSIAVIAVGSTVNLITNPGFETGDLSGWTYSGAANTVDISNEAINVYRGDWALHYWLGDPFQFTLMQTIVDLPAGTYTLSIWVHGSGGETVAQLFTQNCGGEDQTVEIVNTGFQEWSNPTLTDIEVKNESCMIGLRIDAPAGSWAFIDDMTFFGEE